MSTLVAFFNLKWGNICLGLGVQTPFIHPPKTVFLISRKVSAFVTLSNDFFIWFLTSAEATGKYVCKESIL